MMKRFVIVGAQRTGSSAFAEVLNMHPDIACGWEWTQRGLLRNKIRIAEQALGGDFSVLADKERLHIESLMEKKPRWIGYRRLFRSSDKWVVCPCASPALWVDQFTRHLAWLKGSRDIHVLHIVRSNNVDWLRSKYLSNVTKRYVGKAYPENVRVSIPVHAALRRVESKEWVDGRLAALSETNPYVRIYYEDFSGNQREAIASGLALLGCDTEAMAAREPEIRRQSSKEARAQILNYDALKNVLMEKGLLYSSFDQSAVLKAEVLRGA